MAEEEKQKNLNQLADYAEGMFEHSTGAEDLLKGASKYSLQFSTEQIYILTLIRFFARKARGATKEVLEGFYNDYFELNQYNNSALFISTLFRDYSLRDFIGKGLMIDIKK